MSQRSLLEVHVRQKRFASRDVLREIRLQLHEGEVVSLVGASGCGKSTLLRLIAGLDRDFEGSVLLDGQPVREPTRDIRFVFQEPRLFPWLSVARNIAFDREGGGTDDAYVASLLDEVGLSGLGDCLPKQLSGGQAQRVALARGLFVQPRVMLLDEPFSAVDAFTRIRLQDLLLRIVQHHHITVLLVTHDIAEAVRLSDRVLVLDADPGRIAAELSVSLQHPRDQDDPFTLTASADVRRALQAAHPI